MRTGFIDTPVARIGREIQRFCFEQNKGYKEVAGKCNDSLKLLFPDKHFRPISEERIARIVEAFQKPSAKGVAKQIEDYELAAIPHALKFSLDEVMGTNFRRYALIWDPLADPHYSENVLKLLKEHGARAHELIGWAEFLPCSMETPEFMRAHHAQLFSAQPTLSAREWRLLMNQYNEFGDRRRIYALSPERKWKLKHLMRVTDLRRIVSGLEEYSFDKDLRREQLQYLASLILNPDNRMELYLAEDVDIRSIEKSLRDYDSQFCIDEKVSVWRSHGGRMEWSEEPVCTAQNHAVLEEFVRLASVKGAQEVHDQLLDYAQEVR